MTTNDELNVGEATIKLLEQYGVDTVFGIPGVHTLEFCRGLNQTDIQHVQARNEQGAGFMADGYARVSGKPGVSLVISGPGVTNALTAVGQAYADSIPLLLLSSDAASYTLGKGWGCLHEVPCLTDTTAPLTAFSATAMIPEDVPALIAKAFSVFSSERPRPVHIAIPIDILAMPAGGAWQAIELPERPGPTARKIERACELLRTARQPMICVGGGAWLASDAITQIAERLGAAVIGSTAGKGIIDDRHPLSLSAGTVRGEVQKYLKNADVVLAIGTELSEVDSFVETLEINGKIIRIDLDPHKMNDLYPAEVAIIGSARTSAEAILRQLGKTGPRSETAAEVAEIRQAIRANLSDSEVRHCKTLDVLRAALPPETIVMGDICQLVYTGAFAFDVPRPRLWHYPAGYCTLGCGLPDAIGAKLALPDAPVITIAGDGGFMFTVQELVTAAELNLALPIILWNNEGLKQIQDDMKTRDIDLVGVTGINPDFISLARSCRCHALKIDSAQGLTDALSAAFTADRPTLIEVNEWDHWLN
ncbi:MAG: 5-guanidino-2-oxopentanoate decarboxylase [Gammaproteobacteria bacterium]|nr:5-guanidino-2-oxopentanoate decarboxylase [Gammaproteobacteria bacterium]MDH3534993.1 5-guanidino-2-oxopentanoate decarboxylase [Gammaproteobacteria bacterium]